MTDMIAEALRPLARPIDSLRPLPGNPRRGDVEAVARSYATFGQRKPIVARPDGTVIAGNHQLEAARRLGWSSIAVVIVEDDDATAQAYALADNRTSDLGGYDQASLDAMLAEVALDPALLAAAGYSPDLADLIGSGLEPAALGGAPSQPSAQPAAASPSLADRFVLPPFSVLDTRSGPWQHRKAQWMALGIRSEIGRGANLLRFSDSVLTNFGREDAERRERVERARSGLALPLSALLPSYYPQKRAVEEALGREISNAEFEDEHLEIGLGSSLATTGTSVFDPVVCELVYRWFSPPGSAVLDPFAGGSVRGLVASLLGRRYLGVDLREEQVEANAAQAEQIGGDPAPRWICGDSREAISALPADEMADLVFSCPPYADLEVYSEDPRDLSTMEYGSFLAAYREIIAAACARLRPNRFAAFVVGDVRSPEGSYRGFIADTIEAFRSAGLEFYNEAILVQPVGSLPIRAGRTFSAGRKLGKTHQNLLVFVKGDWRAAADACGPVDVSLPEGWAADPTQGERLDQPLSRA